MVKIDQIKNLHYSDRLAITCDTCGKSFSQIVANLTKVFRRKNSRTITRYCSQSCQYKKEPRKPTKKQLNAAPKTFEATCGHCKKIFQAARRTKGKYCSWACTSRGSRKHRSEVLKKNPGKTRKPPYEKSIDHIGTFAYSKTHHILKCEKCKKWWIAPSPERKYCSKNCWNISRKNLRSRAERYLEDRLRDLIKNHSIKGDDRDSFPGWQIDITLPQLKIAIEWDGIFHSKVVGKVTEKKKAHLRKVKGRDKYKVKMLERAGWRILRVNAPNGGEVWYKTLVEQKLESEIIPFLKANKVL